MMQNHEKSFDYQRVLCNFYLLNISCRFSQKLRKIEKCSVVFLLILLSAQKSKNYVLKSSESFLVG